jgi:hypothetical protein
MRSRGVIMGVLLVSVTAGAAVAAAEPHPRAVRAVQQDAELGLTTQTAVASDGALVVTAQAAGLTIDKRVYSDGRFDVRIAFGTNDRVVIAADVDGISVATAHEATIRLNPAGDMEYEPRARRVREWLAASAAVGRFRQLVDALERRGGRDPEALSLRATGALVAELLGDPGAARRFGERVAGGGAGFRKAQQYTQSCWDIYQRLVLQASYQLESCIASFAVYNPLRQVCAAVWILQIESAWFQFLSCSAIPLK